MSNVIKYFNKRHNYTNDYIWTHEDTINELDIIVTEIVFFTLYNHSFIRVVRTYVLMYVYCIYIYISMSKS